MEGIKEQLGNNNPYSELTIEKIEEALKEMMYGKIDENQRDIKLWVNFPNQETADKWLKEVWTPALIEAHEKEIQKNT